MINEVTALSSIDDKQLADHLWNDSIFTHPQDEDECEYLKNLSASQIRAFGKLLLVKASEIELEVA